MNSFWNLARLRLFMEYSIDSIVSKERYCRIELIFYNCSLTSAFVYTKKHKTSALLTPITITHLPFDSISLS